MFRIWVLLLLLGLATSAEAKVKVVATVADLGVIAKEVGGELVDVAILGLHTQEPHTMEPKPSLVLALSRADLVLLVGMDLEAAWLPTLLLSARNANVQKGTAGYLDASTLVAPLDIPLQRVDRSMGDIHPTGNPHYTKDPRNGILLAKGFAERLAEIDPPHASAYRKNAELFASQLQTRIAQWAERLKPANGQPLVTFHRSWTYFAQWAGMEPMGYLEPKPGLPPNAAHVAKILQLIQARKVKLILQEDWYSAATSELLAKQTGATLVRVPGMADPAKRYADYIDVLVQSVAKVFSPS